MVVQGLWEFKSPLMQLPHINDDNLKYFMSKKRQIKSLQQYAQMKTDERRSLLRSLSDEEYENVIKVLGKMPCIDFQITVEGKLWAFRSRPERLISLDHPLIDFFAMFI